jgi:hypothetical protein
MLFAQKNSIRTYSIAVEPKMRIELTTYALRVRCSTPELPGRVTKSLVYSRLTNRHLGISRLSIAFDNVENFPKTQVP